MQPCLQSALLEPRCGLGLDNFDLWFVRKRLVGIRNELVGVAKMNLGLPGVLRIIVTSPFDEVETICALQFRVDDLLSFPFQSGAVHFIVEYVFGLWALTIGLPGVLNSSV
jgi:hypothetical protein